MNVCAAILVDGENVSGKQHVLDVHQFLQITCPWYQAQIQEFAVHGDIRTHRWWRHPAYPISYYQHTGGKNAADEQIRQHAWTLTEQGVSLFYLVSNDKHLAAVADQLETRGCTVFCLGTRLAARVLRRRVNFFQLDQRITLVSGTTALSDLSSQGATMAKSYYSPSTSNAEPTVQERVEQALQLVYQSTLLPDLYPRFLSLFLEWAMQALCMLDQDVICNPADIANILKGVEQDPLLSGCMTADVRPHWESTYAFAKRCEYVYTCGQKDAFRLVSHTPHMTTATLRQASLERNGHDWEHLFSSDLPLEQQDFFRFVERTEQIIWRRWYGRGMEQGAQDMREKRQKAWVTPLFDSDKSREF